MSLHKQYIGFIFLQTLLKILPGLNIISRVQYYRNIIIPTTTLYYRFIVYRIDTINQYGSDIN